MRLPLSVVVPPSSVLEYEPPQTLSPSPGSAVPLLSQPSSAPGAPGREQSEYGFAHVGVHTPPAHTRPVTLFDEQARVQPPQASGVLPMLVVQPSLSRPQ